MTATSASTSDAVEKPEVPRRTCHFRPDRNHGNDDVEQTSVVNDERTAFERKKQRHASGESTVSTDSVGRYIPNPPDGGYGWVIVMASFFNHVIVDGIAYTFGVFYVEFLEEFKESKSKTALVGSLLAGCYLFSAPVASALVNKFGCRPVTIFGAIIAFCGFTLCTLATNVDFLIVTYGIIGGAGLGLFYLPNVIAVSYYFQKRRATATGIALCGAGVGCFVFAPLGEYLLHIYDWKNAMLIVAGITLNGCVFGSLLRPLEAPKRVRRPRAKNILDRLKEQTSQRIGRHRADSECSAGSAPTSDRNGEIFKKLQQIKWAKESALHEEEDSISDYGSILNSTRRLDTADTDTREPSSADSRPVPIPPRPSTGSVSSSAPAGGLPPSKSDGFDCVTGASFQQSSVESPNLSPTADAIEDATDVDAGVRRERVLCASDLPQDAPKSREGGSNGCPIGGVSGVHSNHDNNPVRRNVSTVSFSSSNVVVYAPTQTPPISESNGNSANGRSQTTKSYDESCRLRLPQGVHRQDFARPLYRSDIFYSGSILNIPEYRSQLEIENYVRSVTMIPEVVQPDAECCLWRHLPVSKALKDTLKRMTDLSLVRDPLFLVPAVSNLIGSVGLFVPFVYITKRATDLGVDPSDAAWLLSTIGITNTIGRILAGLFADDKRVNKLLMHNAALMAAGLVCLSNAFCTTYYSMYLFAAVFGLCIATWITLTSIVLCDLLGLERLTNAFGLLCMSRGMAAMIGSPIAGAVYDLTGNYDAPFHVSGAMLLIGGATCCLLHLPYFQLRSLTATPAGDIDVEGDALTAAAVDTCPPGVGGDEDAAAAGPTTAPLMAAVNGSEGMVVSSLSTRSVTEAGDAV